MVLFTVLNVRCWRCGGKECAGLFPGSYVLVVRENELREHCGRCLEKRENVLGCSQLVDQSTDASLPRTKGVVLVACWTASCERHMRSREIARVTNSCGS